MEGNIIERRTSSAQLWGDARQHTEPSTSTASPVGVPAYSNIFVTPPEHREPEHGHLERSHEIDKPEIGASKLSQIKDKHDGETQNSILCFEIGHFIQFHFFIFRNDDSEAIINRTFSWIMLNEIRFILN